MSTSALASAALFAHRAALRLGGYQATLTRGAATNDSVCVLPGRQDQQNQGLGEGGSGAGAVANFEIARCDYTLDDEMVFPVKGDVMTVEFPTGVTETFVVVDGPNRRPWDWADNHHQIMTVHFAGRG